MGQVEMWVIGTLLAAVSVLIGVLAYTNSRRKDRETQIRDQAITSATTNEKLNSMLNTLQAMDKSVSMALGGIEARFKGLMDKLDSQAERLAKVEEKAASAHKRIDELKGGYRDE